MPEEQVTLIIGREVKEEEAKDTQIVDTQEAAQQGEVGGRYRFRALMTCWRCCRTSVILEDAYRVLTFRCCFCGALNRQ